MERKVTDFDIADSFPVGTKYTDALDHEFVKVIGGHACRSKDCLYKGDVLKTDDLTFPLEVTHFPELP